MDRLHHLMWPGLLRSGRVGHIKSRMQKSLCMTTHIAYVLVLWYLLTTYTVAGSRSSSMASRILRRCRLDSSLNADSSSASLRPSSICVPVSHAHLPWRHQTARDPH